MSKTKFHLSSDDFYRVLLSDVQPYHMPMIFSNEGCKQLNKIYTNLPIYYYNR